jgi:arsenate reductase
MKLYLLIPILALVACSAPRSSASTMPEATMTETHPNLHPDLQRYVESLASEFDAIPDERRQTLDRIAAFVDAEHQAGRSAKLVFICTHNSRRSQMSQSWATTAAAWYRIADVEAYSGGTEATAFNPRAVAALRRAGFVIDEPTEAGDNPHYQLGYSSEQPPIAAYSKQYASPDNPSSEFAAIMTCSEADDACPFVPGATLRISLAYDDPKQADGTAEEQARYDERCRQIAREMFYLFSRVRR